MIVREEGILGIYRCVRVKIWSQLQEATLFLLTVNGALKNTGPSNCDSHYSCRGLFPVMMRQSANSAVRFSSYSSLKVSLGGLTCSMLVEARGEAR